MTRLLAISSTVCVLAVCAVASRETVQVGRFSALDPGRMPAEWSPMTFPQVSAQTRYSLAEHDGRVAVRAESRSAASALVKRVTVDLDVHPGLYWSWKTDPSCVAGDWRNPSLDDFPVRLFVLFEGNGGLFSFFRRFASDFDGDAVLYVAGDGPTPEQIEPNRESHLTDRIRVVPLASPAERSGRWDQQVRNVRADYLELFGREPNEVSAVAIMTDTDDMGTECTSFYGDIYFAAETDERR